MKKLLIALLALMLCLSGCDKKDENVAPPDLDYDLAPTQGYYLKGLGFSLPQGSRMVCQTEDYRQYQIQGVKVSVLCAPGYELGLNTNSVKILEHWYGVGLTKVYDQVDKLANDRGSSVIVYEDGSGRYGAYGFYYHNGWCWVVQADCLDGRAKQEDLASIVMSGKVYPDQIAAAPKTPQYPIETRGQELDIRGLVLHTGRESRMVETAKGITVTCADIPIDVKVEMNYGKTLQELLAEDEKWAGTNDRVEKGERNGVSYEVIYQANGDVLVFARYVGAGRQWSLTANGSMTEKGVEVAIEVLTSGTIG